MSYLAARGLPLRHVDTRGSSAHFLDRLQAAAPQARVVLVHAGAPDLARLFGRRALRPLLLAADQPDSLTHAYAAMKLLVMRCALMSYDLLLAAPPEHRRATGDRPAPGQLRRQLSRRGAARLGGHRPGLRRARQPRRGAARAGGRAAAAAAPMRLDVADPGAAAWRQPAVAAHDAMNLN